MGDDQQALADDLINTRLVDESRPISYKLLALELGIPFNDAKDMLLSFAERNTGSTERVYGLLGVLKTGASAAPPGAHGVRLVREADLATQKQDFDEIYAEYVHAIAPKGGVPLSASLLYAAERAAVLEQFSPDVQFGGKLLSVVYPNLTRRSDASSMLKGMAPAVPQDHDAFKHARRAESAPKPRAAQKAPAPKRAASTGRKPAAGGGSGGKPTAKKGMGAFFKVETDSSKRFAPKVTPPVKAEEDADMDDPFDDLSDLDEDSRMGGQEPDDDGASSDFEDIAGAAAAPPRGKKRQILDESSASADAADDSGPESPVKRARTAAQEPSPVPSPKKVAQPRKPKKLRADADAGAGKELKIKRKAKRRAIVDEDDEFDESEEEAEETKPKPRRRTRLPVQANTLDTAFAAEAPLGQAASSGEGGSQKRIVKRRVKKEIEYQDEDGYTVFGEHWTDEEVEIEVDDSATAEAERKLHQENERVAKIAQAAKQGVLPGAKKAGGDSAPKAARKKKAAPKNASILSFFQKK